MRRTTLGADRQARLQHACVTLDQLRDETDQLYLTIETQARLIREMARRSAALKPSPVKRGGR